MPGHVGTIENNFETENETSYVVSPRFFQTVDCIPIKSFGMEKVGMGKIICSLFSECIWSKLMLNTQLHVSENYQCFSEIVFM